MPTIAANEKWHVLAAAEGIHLLLGGVYAWSVYARELEAHHGFSRLDTQLVFGTIIACLTLSMVVAGKLLQRLGARLLIRIAAVTYGIGYSVAAAFGAGVTATILGVGLIGGVGIGTGYVISLTVAVAAFQQRRGLVAGVVTAGFAAASALLAPLVAVAFRHGFSVPTVFAVQGVIVFLGLTLAASWVHDNLKQGSPEQVQKSAKPPPGIVLWNALGLFGSSFAGLLVIGGLASIAAARTDNPSMGPLAVVGFALGNTVGRPTWGLLFDRFGAVTPPMALGLLAAAIVGLAHPELPNWLVLLLSVAIGFGFASGFVLYAASTVRHLGPASLGTVYPRIFLAYGLAALIGPPLGGFLQDMFHSTQIALLVAAVVAMAAGVSLGARELLRSRGTQPSHGEATRPSSLKST